MKNEIFSLGLLFLFCLDVSALTNELPDSWYFESDYLQGNIYGKGEEGYVYNDVCHAVVSLAFTNIYEDCGHGQTGTKYSYTGFIRTDCVRGQNIIHYFEERGINDNAYAFPFISNGNSIKVNESFILSPSFYPGYADSQNIWCEADSGNKTCYIEFTSPSDNYVCWNDAYEYENQDLYFWVGTEYKYTYEDSRSGLNLDGLFEGALNVTDSYLFPWGGYVTPPTSSTGTYGIISSGEYVDLNYSESVIESLNTIDKTLIINITNVPDDVVLTSGETGLWDCDTPGKTQYYLSETNPSFTTYISLKQNCCNRLESSLSCVHYPSTSTDRAVDENGNFQYNLKITCATVEFTPQFVYYYNTIAYPDYFVQPVIVDMFNSENPIELTLLWNTESSKEYEACFNFYDAINSSLIIPDKRYIALSETDSNYLFFAFDMSDYELYLTSFDELFYKIYFTKTGYSDTTLYSGRMSYDPKCINVYMDRNYTDTDISYNATVHVMTSDRAHELTGVNVKITCKANGESYISNKAGLISSTSGYFFTGALDSTYCYVTASKDKCIDKTREFFISGANRDMNMSLTCTDEVELSDGSVLTDDGKFDMEVFVHKIGSSNGLSAITVELSGTSQKEATTNSIGYAYFYNLIEDGEYQITVDTDDYSTFKGEFDGSLPFDVSLFPIQEEGYIFILTKLNNSVLGGVSLTVTSDGKTIETGTSDTSDLYKGNYDFYCEIGKLYSVTGVYQGKEAVISNIECEEGEGKTFTLDLDGGVRSVGSEASDNIVGFGAWIEPYIEYLLLFFSGLVFVRVAKEYGK